ncbi:MAG: hypothetical protein KAS86_00585 [Candidatus Omnitrophica bacterium]|nr:hypothetical protein [Candidatus Omnitrophota bacterium]
MIWFEFVACSAFLTYFAYKLCRQGIVLSERTGIAQGLVGVVFLAIATSFPEIVTAATSVFFLGRIGLGYGDIIGSVMINLMVLAGLDYFAGGGRILLKASRLNRLTGGFVLLLLFIIMSAVVLRLGGIAVPSFRRIGAENFLIIPVYFVWLLIIGKRGAPGVPEVSGADGNGSGKLWIKFILLLIAVMFLGAWMAGVGEKIVVGTGLSQTFTGVLLLGFATSLPEIIVSFVALRAGSVDMAVGNILGSNLFDVCIIPLLDILTASPILGLLSAGQMISTVVAFVLSAIVVLGFLMRRETSSRINWDTGAIFAIGFLGFVIICYVR